MTGLDKIRECMCQCLTQAGIHAVTAWSREEKKRYTGPVAAVSLRACQGGPGGFQDYLGERFNSDSQRWEEVYGKRARLTFGLDIYSDSRDGAADCQSAFDAMVEALSEGLPSGLNLESLSRGESVYDKETGLFCCNVEAVCGAYLYAVADEDGVFADFEVRGERRK